jgi:hypothetical protein
MSRILILSRRHRGYAETADHCSPISLWEFNGTSFSVGLSFITRKQGAVRSMDWRRWHLHTSPVNPLLLFTASPRQQRWPGMLAGCTEGLPR